MPDKGLSESVQQIEAARDASRNEGFVASLFEARPRWGLLHMFDQRKTSAAFPAYRDAFRGILGSIDPDEVDRTGEISDSVIAALRNAGAFALKVPKELGGVGLTQSDYQELAALMGSWCGNTTALVSANNSLGLSETLKQFGTPEQKERWLPKLAEGWISGLALTEAEAGTDVTRVEARAEPVYDDGVLTGWRLYGRKQWCTNAAKSDTEFLADVLVIIARLPDVEKRGKKRKQFGAFIVPTRQNQGIRLIKRNHFSGLKAIYNGDIQLDGVFVPAGDRIRDQAKARRGDDNDGLSIALTCITIGRLTLPSAGLGGLKRALWMARTWANKRVSMGRPIGEFQSIAELIVRTAARVMALEAMTKLCGIWADHFGNRKLLIESGMVKVMGSSWYHQAIDDLFFIRAGRAFETVESLAARGDEPWAIERMRRDEIINLIFEGANPALMLQGGREGNAELINIGMPGTPLGKRLSSALRVGLGLLRSLNPFGGFFTGGLGGWGGYFHSESQRLTRNSFLTVARYQKSLERDNQLALADLSRSAMGIFAGGATQAYARELGKNAPGYGQYAQELADWFVLDAAGSSEARRQIMPLARRILNGDAAWLEAGMV